MLKANKFVSSCSKLAIGFALVLLATSLVFGFTACSNPSDDSGSDSYAVQPDHSNSCGAYAAAYYLADTNQIKKSEIKRKADDIYNNGNVQFGSSFSNIVYNGDTLDLSSYINPASLRDYLSDNNFATRATLKLISASATGYAEQLVNALKDVIGITIPDSDRIDNFEDGFADCDYCIEIITVGDHRLHYIFTYYKDGELYTRDPGDATEYKRSEITTAHGSYRFSNSGIFIKK